MDLSRTIARTDAHKKLNEKAEDNRNEIALNIQRLDSQKERIEDLAVEAKCHRIAAASVAIDQRQQIACAMEAGSSGGST